MKGKWSVAAMILLVVLLFTGCYAFDSDDFYALPKRSEKYRSLQAAVEEAMGDGSYSAPVSGANRQTIQQVDLDGDGVEEALVFCKMDAERPLKVLILKQSREDYRVICTLEGDGSAFDSVQYAQIDGEPGLEILLSRRIGEQVQQFLSVYSLKNDTVTELMSSRYAAFTTLDIDGDQLTDLFLLLANPNGPSAIADLYRFHDGELQKEAEASLSMSADSVKRILTGNLAQDVPAVFVASAYDENNLITDVFAMGEKGFANITRNDESGQSSQTVRNYYVYSTDIDNDGLIEMPNTLPLQPIAGDEGSEGQYRIVWYNLGVDGARTEKMTTYHNYGEGWFLYLPESWCENLCVTKVQIGESRSGTEFSTVDETGNRVVLLTVIAYSGDGAEAQCEQEGRFLLSNRGDVFFAALMGEGCTLTREELQARFSFISLDLLPGEGTN